MTNRVVNLGPIRDLLADWDRVREAILRGDVKAFALTMRGLDGQEAIFLGGDFKRDYADALMASLRTSWHMTQAEEAQDSKTGT